MTSPFTDILEHTVYREGTGPNGSGGEFLYGYIDKTLDPRYSQVVQIPLEQAIKAAIAEAIEQAKNEAIDDCEADMVTAQGAYKMDELLRAKLGIEEDKT